MGRFSVAWPIPGPAITTMRVTTRVCMVCGQTSVVTMTNHEYASWFMGYDVQTVFPSWSPEQRELLITGTHPECWATLFGDEDGA